jgi:GH15 family glucan-1,4-alpha-glucosidase
MSSRSRPAREPPRPIADHGVIGNLSTMALVARDGAIDFLCWPRFDSPSLFAALLDPEVGGVFELQPHIDGARVFQTYLPDSNVLATRWMGEQSSAEIVDLMTAPTEPGGESQPELIRRVRATRGRVRVRLRCAPRFDYGRITPTLAVDRGQVCFAAAGQTPVRLTGAVEFRAVDGAAEASFELAAGEWRDFVLDEPTRPPLTAQEREAAVTGTNRYWQAWAARSTYRGRWRDVVTRSALVLKLMTSHRYGSIVAATTFGLPEAPGGARNWDYRATWIRDASFTVYALIRLGYKEEAIAFSRWISDRASCCQGSLDVMYAVDGGAVPAERALDHLGGYGGARPVRIGNDARDQLQLDIYGALLDSIYLTNKYGEASSHADWQGVCRVVDYVCANWQRPDSGIWEVRNGPSENLHSRLMCWVAVDRALRMASKRSLRAPFADWIAARNAINEDIWSRFWDDEQGHFVRNCDTRDLDGSMLMMPLVRFIGSKDPAWLATLDAIGKQLTDDSLVMRYQRGDGLDGKEGSFAACAFWFVECLARAGRIEQARAHFEKLVSYGNHLQLYAEELSGRGDLLGNFPQALTHLALISAAFYLDRAIDGPREHWPA